MSLVCKKLLFPAPPLNGDQDTAPDDYVFESQLGNGAFGQVWKIRQKSSNKIYACKIVMKETVSRMIEQFRREVLIMYKLSHPHIIKLYSHFEDDENFYLVMELAEGGNLFQRLAKEKTFIERLAFKFFKEILSAVEYLHLQNPAIIHRDIKPENILISAQGKAKLTDFGWSNYYSSDKSMHRYTLCGTYEYLCPEMIKESGHTPTVDIWCMGILLYEMYCGHTPFKAQTKEMLMENISKGKIRFPDAMSQALKNLITKILEKQPEKRITIHGIKSHEWFKKFDFISPLKKSKDSKDNLKKDENKAKNVNIKSKEVQLNLFRKSIMGIQAEITQKNEQSKDLKNMIKAVAENIKNEEISLKIVDREVLEKKKEILMVEQSISELKEKLYDLDLILERIVIPYKIEDLQQNLADKMNEMDLRIFEITDFEIKLFDIQQTLQETENKHLDKSRYLQNMTQYLKKLKDKGSLFHRTTESQIAELSISSEILKTKIQETEKKLVFLETPENKSARKLMNYVKTKKDLITNSSNIEEKLMIVEENLVLKEVDLERLKIDYLDRKKHLIKESWVEREKAVKRKLHKEEFFKYLKNAIGVKQILQEFIDRFKNSEMQYKMGVLDVDDTREKLGVSFK